MYISSADILDDECESFVNLQNGHNGNTLDDAKIVREKFVRSGCI